MYYGRRADYKEIKKDGSYKIPNESAKGRYSIPKGSTLIYKELANKAGYPNAFKAVGSVMKMNPLAPTISCHRVIKSDGSLGNYSRLKGTSTKMRMLKREHAI